MSSGAQSILRNRTNGTTLNNNNNEMTQKPSIQQNILQHIAKPHLKEKKRQIVIIDDPDSKISS